MRANKIILLAILITGTMVLGSAVARADWDPSYPNTKWVQFPEIEYGLDVNATYLVDTSAPIPPGAMPIYPWQKILADDFPCWQPGPITDIHLWGSWLENRMYPATTFKLSIHSDVPAGLDAPYSHPGDELWSMFFTPGTYAYRPVGTGMEYFYEPNTDAIIGTDTIVWQYNFDIDPAMAFIQQGTTADPMIYWLDVQAIIPQPAPESGTTLPDFVFGWKTSIQSWNDDAVYGDTDIPGGLPYPQFSNPDYTGLIPWNDMIYPIGPRMGESINLAFVITTVPEPGTFALAVLAAIAAACFARKRSDRAAG